MPNQVSPRTKVRLFTDDCMVCCEVKSHQLQDQVTLQRDLHALQLWAERWGMRFNPQKCDIMHIAHQAHRVQMYELCGVTLDSVTQAKYLGAIISADLQWHSQVCAVAKKANTTLYFIYRTLKYCPRSSRATAYTSVVRSGMEHCAGIWDPPPPKQQDKNTLEKVNRRTLVCSTTRPGTITASAPPPCCNPLAGITRGKALQPTHGAHVQHHT